ncbi:MAG: class A beta-lactamase-related serine hydrolase [Bacillota bacterium]|nr:class A beta-lactamase-related serine hydrolase [Bacillota bacterium]
MEWPDEVKGLLEAFPGEVSLAVEVLPEGGGPGARLSHRAEEAYPAASLIKLPVLLAALEAAERGELPLEQEVAVGGEATGGAGVVEHFHPGTRLTLGDLLLCMTAVSDNAATNHVLDLVGFEAVNALSSRLGLKDTLLRRRMMDAAARAAGRENTTTAADMHRLLRQLVRPELVSPRVAAHARRLLALQQLKLGFGTFLPEERVAHKTGDLAGLFHDAGLVDPEGPVTVVYAFLSRGVENLGEASVAAGRVGQAVAAWAASLAGEGRGR